MAIIIISKFQIIIFYKMYSHIFNRDNKAKLVALEEAKKVILTQWTKKIIVEKQMSTYDNLQEPMVIHLFHFLNYFF